MKNVLIQKGKDQLRHFKMLADELEVQMALGKLEAREALERERKNFSKYINFQKSELTKADERAYAYRDEFLTCMDLLASSLNVVVPTGKRAYEKYKQSILSNIYQLEDTYKNHYDDANFELQQELDAFKVKLDAFRVNMALHDKDNPEKVQELRNEVSARLDAIRDKLALSEDDESKLENFVEDVSDAFKMFRRAVENLTS